MKQESAPATQRAKTIWSSILGAIAGIGLRLLGISVGLSLLLGGGLALFSFLIV